MSRHEKAASRLDPPPPLVDELLATSDVVLLLCALTPETTHLIGAPQLALMRDGAVLVNCARGEVVDQAALAAALAARPSLRAGLDVCTPEPLPRDSPLLALPNCLVLPHIGSASTGRAHGRDGGPRARAHAQRVPPAARGCGGGARRLVDVLEAAVDVRDGACALARVRRAAPRPAARHLTP